MESDSNKLHKLFLVVLGGRTRHSHIELHDVRWVVGKNIEETFLELRRQWFGDIQGLHMDSYMEIKFIDGHEIKVSSNFANRIDEHNYYVDNLSVKKNYLWFVNIGGYDSNQLSELHEFGLVIAGSASDAKKEALTRYLKGSKQVHKDDLKKIDQIDDCHAINCIQGWTIELVEDPDRRSQEMKPDWYGFREISTS